MQNHSRGLTLVNPVRYKSKYGLWIVDAYKKLCFLCKVSASLRMRLPSQLHPLEKNTSRQEKTGMPKILDKAILNARKCAGFRILLSYFVEI